MIALAAMAGLCGCATSRTAPSLPPSARSDGHIYVTSEGLPGDCYHDLGPVGFTEPYFQSVIDSGDGSQTTQRLRDLARQKYAADADAVIEVREQQNDAGTEVTVVGEAVRLQNHETIECTVRKTPAVLDAASNVAAGGMLGTAVGGILGAGGSSTGAMAGGAIGATAAAGIQAYKYAQQQQADEARLTDRIQQQRQQIKQLSQTLAKLVVQQCDAEELSEEDCSQRVAASQQAISKAQPAGGSGAATVTMAAQGTPAGTVNATRFEVQNRIQEQQETIDRLQRQIAEIKHKTRNQ